MRGLTKNYKFLWLRDITMIVAVVAAMYLSVLPSFNFVEWMPYENNLLLYQFGSAAVLSACVAAASVFCPNGVKNLSVGLCGYLLLMLFLALRMQFRAHLASPDSKGWIYIFYYDKPFSVLIGFASAMLVICAFRLLIKQGDCRNNFNFFLKVTSIGFLIFYALILVYLFYIVRTGSQMGKVINLVPFNNFREYLDGTMSLYEGYMYILGNVFVLFPMGFYLRILFPRKKVFAVLLFFVPIVVSTFIEWSQYYFDNGICDVDDIMLNCFGFYIGALFVVVIDRLRRCITKGEENGIFIL